MSQKYPLHPLLMPYISALASHEFGLQSMRAKIKSAKRGRLILNNGKKYKDRFRISIPYCTKKIKWTIVMHPDNLMEQPDFIMDENFLVETDFELFKSQLPGLANWQPDDPKCLLQVMLQMLESYKISQFLHMTKPFNLHKRISLELKTILQSKKFSLKNMELYVHNAKRVSLLMDLKVDHSKLAPHLTKERHLSLLLVEIGRNSNVVSLIKHEDVREFYENVDLPILQSKTTLVEYFSVVRKFLQSKIDHLAWKLNQRKKLYSLFYQLFRPAMLDGDNVTFKKFSFLLECIDEFFVVIIRIPMNFPEEAPRIAISSLECHRCEIPVLLPCNKYKYDQMWDTTRIFTGIYDFVVGKLIPLYQKQIAANYARMGKGTTRDLYL